MTRARSPGLYGPSQGERNGVAAGATIKLLLTVTGLAIVLRVPTPRHDCLGP